MSSGPKASIRIAGCSGSVTDRRDALARLARDDDVDAIIGDWMSEYNMTSRGGDKHAQSANSNAFEPSFIEALLPAIDDLAKHGKKLVCNAGASDTSKLAVEVKRLFEERGHKVNVAWIEGDEVFKQLQSLTVADKGAAFASLTTEKTLQEWGYTPIYAQAYLGSFGIVKALQEGADIVVCGRVADASPVIGLAAWYHNWSRTDLDELAGAFIAGHIAECSAYVTGGNWSGFRALAPNWDNLGFPIVEIAADGTFVTTLEKGAQGIVSPETIKSQLLYEIQGPLYYNSDVVAELSNIVLEEQAPNRVKTSGVKGIPPPPTTKVGVTALGGYQAELSYYFCGLHIKEKGQMLEAQCRAALDAESFSLLKFTITGTAAEDPQSQDEATVEFRIFAQAKSEEALSMHKFFRPISDQIMQSYPGATFGVDTRKSSPKQFYEYFVSLLPQSELQHKAHVNGQSFDIPAPTKTVDFVAKQDSYDTKGAVPFDSFGSTKRAAMGTIVHARSGDKSSDANVGFYVRNADEWDWLRSLLSIEKIKTLLGKDYKGERVDRFEMPHLWAVHFLLKNHLDRGVASTSTYDYLGKNVAEYLRAKHVDIPVKFLERGSI